MVRLVRKNTKGMKEKVGFQIFVQSLARIFGSGGAVWESIIFFEVGV